jgi:hypothetical protein
MSCVEGHTVSRLVATNDHASMVDMKDTTSPTRQLAALGHPGYSRQFAARVLATMSATGCTAHEAIYGRRPSLW